MVRTPVITPTHPLIRTYHQTLERYSGQRVEHESALRSAFQKLLADSARLQGWTLIPELGPRWGTAQCSQTASCAAKTLDQLLDCLRPHKAAFETAPQPRPPNLETGLIEKEMQLTFEEEQ